MNKKSELDCFLFYMWNVWSKEECINLFGECFGEHMWEKWCRHYDRCTASGAPAPFYADCDTEVRAKIVARALAHYNE